MVGAERLNRKPSFKKNAGPESSGVLSFLRSLKKRDNKESRVLKTGNGVIERSQLWLSRVRGKRD